MGLFSSKKKRPNVCKSGQVQCGKTWGPKEKTELAKESWTWKSKQCPKCEKKEKKILARAKHEFLCPCCLRHWDRNAQEKRRKSKKKSREKVGWAKRAYFCKPHVGHGKKYRKGSAVDTEWKKCKTCKRTRSQNLHSDSFGGLGL